MKLNSILVLFAISSIILFSNCASTEVADSRDVNQQKIYQDYEVVYNEENGNAQAEAVFRFGGNKGTTLILSDSSNVKVNNNNMLGSELLFRGYVYEFFGFDEATTFFEFKFTDTEGNQYVNGINVYPIDKINIPDSIALYQNSTVSWIGPSVQSGEQVEVIIEDMAGNQAKAKTRIKGANEVLIQAENVTGLVEGTGNLYIRREINNSLKQSAEMGGTIKSLYYTAIVKIHIGGLAST